jgi:phosphatidate cytidylyltransferase
MKSKLLVRILIGVALGAAVFFALWTVRPAIAVLAAAWSVLATLEFVALLRRAEIRLNRWLLSFANVATVAAALLGWLPAFLIAPAALVFLSAVMEREPKPRIPVYGLFTVFYLGFLPAHVVLLKNLVVVRQLSPWLAFFPLALTWLNDTAAMVAGRLFGRHKLAPLTSPNKTVEGYLTGLVFSGVAAALWLSRLAPFSTRPLWWLAVVGVGIGTIAQAGDLFESMFKRAIGAKDSSTALADHGGFLDRVDSLLFAIPAFYYLLLLLR